MFMGSVGFIFLIFWLKYVHAPKKSRYINQAELDYITNGGALVEMDHGVKNNKVVNDAPTWQLS